MGPDDGRDRRRGNGFLSPSWVRLTDLDPVLAEHVLEVLATERIAAYAAPVEGSVGGYLEVRLPDRPTDRVYVDPLRADEARGLVSAALAEHEQAAAEQERAAGDPAPPEASVGSEAVPAPAPAQPSTQGQLTDDEVWAGIVEGFDRGPEGPVAPWPTTEDVEPEKPRLTTVRDIQARMRAMREQADNPLDQPAQDEELPEGVDPADLDRYVPPPPPPLPKASPAFWGAIATIAFGMVLMVFPEIFLGLPRTPRTFGVGILLIVGGAGLLVYRLNDGPPTDSGPEDGAVV